MRTTILAATLVLFPIYSALASEESSPAARADYAAVQTTHDVSPASSSIFTMRRQEPILIPYDTQKAKTETPLWDLDN